MPEHVDYFAGGFGFAGQFDDAAGGGGIDGSMAVRQVIGRAAPREVGRIAPGQLQDALNFLVALFHAVAGAAGTVVEEGRGGYCAEVDLFRRKQRVGERELVVHFVEGVGIEDRVDPAGGNLQPGSHGLFGQNVHDWCAPCGLCYKYISGSAVWQPRSMVQFTDIIAQNDDSGMAGETAEESGRMFF